MLRALRECISSRHTLPYKLLCAYFIIIMETLHITECVDTQHTHGSLKLYTHNEKEMSLTMEAASLTLHNTYQMMHTLKHIVLLQEAVPTQHHSHQPFAVLAAMICFHPSVVGDDIWVGKRIWKSIYNNLKIFDINAFITHLQFNAVNGVDHFGIQRGAYNCIAIFDCLEFMVKGREEIVKEQFTKEAHKLCKRLQLQLDPPYFKGLSETDMGVYQTEEGDIYYDKDIYIPKEVESKNLKMDKNMKALYGDEVAELIANDPKRQSSKSAPTKSSSSKDAQTFDKQMKYTLAERELLGEQKKLRDEMNNKVLPCNYSLKGIRHLSSAKLVPMKPNFSALLFDLFELLTCPLISHEVYLTFSSILYAYIPHKSFHYTNELLSVVVEMALFPTKFDRLLELLKVLVNEQLLSFPVMEVTSLIISKAMNTPELCGYKICSCCILIYTKQLQLKNELNPSVVLRDLSNALRVYPSLISVSPDVFMYFFSYPLPIETLVFAFRIAMTRDVGIRIGIIKACALIDVFPLELIGFVFTLMHDEEVEVSTIAASVFASRYGRYPLELLQQLIEFISCDSTTFRNMAAKALASYVSWKRKVEGETVDVCTVLLKGYEKGCTMDVKLGRLAALASCAKLELIDTKEVVDAVISFLYTVVAEDPLIKQSDELRSAAFAAGQSVIEHIHEYPTQELFKTIRALTTEAGKEHDTEYVSTVTALLYGGIAQKMDANDATVKQILDHMIDTLLSEQSSSIEVQKYVGSGISPLVKMWSTTEGGPEDIGKGLERLLKGACETTDFNVRRGGALGVGSVIKGLSILAMKQYNVIQKLENNASDKSPLRRQGALMCFEALSSSLGRLFEPYVMSILPFFLKAFSDTSLPVRQAAEKAAVMVMSQLSGHGVKLVLPTLLKSIGDHRWRTKVGSIELLGMMANCAPRQLSACLPQAVPALCAEVSDSNLKVKQSAYEALNRIGSVIGNAEIKELVPQLIEALANPTTDKTQSALQAVIDTSFVHSVDAPSLAIICPIINLALKDRVAETKKLGAFLIMYMNTVGSGTHNSFTPYIPTLLPGVKAALIDPIPNVRSTAAKAIGNLAKAMSNIEQDEVLQWLFEVLKVNDSPVERSGAANGLSEVLLALGPTKLKAVLPYILNAIDVKGELNEGEVPQEGEREGLLGIFIFLPVAFQDEFESYVPSVLPALLNAMADQAESVREVAFRAATALVKQYGVKFTASLFNPIEEGALHNDWRIRQCSVSLLGLLLDTMMKYSGSPDDAEELGMLSFERRSFLLSSLYMLRADENKMVSQTATTVWKEIVHNTVKTMKELLPILMKRLINMLTSSSFNRRSLAGRCIGDLVLRLGSLVLTDLMPIFIQGLSSHDAHHREGVCMGLAEVITHSSKSTLSGYVDSLVNALKITLCDEDANVQKEASKCVSLLRAAIGDDLLDLFTIPFVASILSTAVYTQEDAQPSQIACLQGVDSLLKMNPHAVIPVILERAAVPPYDIMKLKLLTSATNINSNTKLFNDALPTLLPALLDAYASFYANDIKDTSLDESDGFKEAASAMKKIASHVSTEGVSTLLNTITIYMHESKPIGDYSADGIYKLKSQVSSLKYEDIQQNVGVVEADVQNAYKRSACAVMLKRLIECCQTSLVEHITSFSALLFPLCMTDPNGDVLGKGVEAFDVLCKSIKKEEMAEHLSELHSHLQKLVTDHTKGREVDGVELPGLTYKAALEVLCTIYQHSLMFGTVEGRETAAAFLGTIINHTSIDSLKPFLIRVTGPLIRIVGDRFPATVKIAILDTLRTLLVKGGILLKPLMPQLQTTFLKCLLDSSNGVRTRASTSLSLLSQLNTSRIDSLLNELCTSLLSPAFTLERTKDAVRSTTTDGGLPIKEIRGSLMNVISNTLKQHTDGLSDVLLQKIQGIAFAIVKNPLECEEAKLFASKTYALLLSYQFNEVDARVTLQTVLQLKTSSDADTRMGLAMILHAFASLHPCWEKLMKAGCAAEFCEITLMLMRDESKIEMKKFGALIVLGLCKHIRDEAAETTHLFGLLESVELMIRDSPSTVPPAMMIPLLKGCTYLPKMCVNSIEEATRLSTVCAIAAPFLITPSPAVKLQAELALYRALRVNQKKYESQLKRLREQNVIPSTKLHQLTEYTRRVLTKTTDSTNFEDDSDEEM